MSTISYKQNSLRRIFTLCLSMLLMACGGGGSATPTGLPELTVDSPSLTEGNAGSTNLTFIATLSQTDAADVSVDIATADITAVAGSDYSVLITTVTIPAGATQASFSVPVSGDTDIESDESFAMNLTNISSNANLVTTSATGMILNDDSIPAAPSASLSIQSPKGIQLSWNSVSEATYYQVFKNPDGASGFNIIADNLTGLEYTDTVAVHLYDWLNARYLVTACNASGCDQSNELTTLGGATASIGYFKPSNTNTPQNGLIGMAIALSDDGRTLVVGSPTEASNAVGINGDQNNTDASDSGAVYVFRYDGSLWVQEAYIKASNAEAFDRFGEGIALNSNGTVLAVGAFLEDSNATDINGDETDNSISHAGAVYLFLHDGTQWFQEAYIKASNTGSDDFGYRVALSDDGDTLVVGAAGEGSNATEINGDQTNNFVPGSGAAYVFFYDGADWAQQAYIKASNTDRSDKFGFAMALSADGNVLAVSARDEESNATGVNGDETDNSVGGAGAAYVFTRTGSAWLQQAYIKATNTELDDLFGAALALSGDGLYLVVGAPGESSNATDINGDQADNSAAEAGAVYTYRYDGSTWQTEDYLKASNTEVNDTFGNSIGLNATGDVLVVGAMSEDSRAIGIDRAQNNNGASNSGAAFVFIRNAAVWSPQAYIKASNTEAQDSFGLTVSISADGKTLAVSAPFEDSAATGINGDQTDNSVASSGAVYLY